MAGDKLKEKITELGIEKEAITATLNELKGALDKGEITEDDYSDSKKDYDERLSEIEKELAACKAKQDREAAKPIYEVLDYESLSWTDLQKLASDRGILVVGKGVTKDKVIADLEAQDKKGAAAREAVKEEAPAPVEEAPVKDVAPPTVEEAPAPVKRKPAPIKEEEEDSEASVKDEIPPRHEIDPSITARVEMLKGEIPALNSTINSLNMKLQVSTSSLNMITKNKNDGLVDATTYNNLKSKYEIEIDAIKNKVKEIEKEVNARTKVVDEYGNVEKIYEDYSKNIDAYEEDISKKEMELNFMGSGKFYLVSNIKDHISKILTDIEVIEEMLSHSGVSYPDETYLEDRNGEIERESETLLETKTKASNFETLLKSLDKELKEDEIDKDTYTLLKTEYTREKNSAIKSVGKVDGRLRMLKTEMKAYEKLEDSLSSCKSYIDMVVDSFNKIWLEEKINSTNIEINKKTEMIKDQVKEMSSKLTRMEREVEALLSGLS